MKKKLLALCLTLALLCGAGALAAGESYSFPAAGVFVEPAGGWQLFSPETLDAAGETLTRLGADADVLRADWAAAGTVFEIFLPDGVQVRLNCLETDEAAALDDASWMTDDQRAAFLASYDHAPYENVGWDAENAGWLTFDWTLQAGGAQARFSWLVSVRQGALYCLTASSADASYDALRAANREVLARTTFLGARVGAQAAQAGEDRLVLPETIADDGRVTPLSLPGFTGVSIEDTYPLTIETLPGAELTLLTAAGSLRGVADETGRHTYNLSTKQTKTYEYTLVAAAEGRAESRMEIALRRELTGEARAAAYRKSAKSLDEIYPKVAKDPAAYRDQAVAFRGRAAEVRDLNGLPCALVYTANPGTGVWKDPVWVLLNSAETIVEGTVYTVYGDVRGDALPVPDAEDLAPVIVCQTVR